MMPAQPLSPCATDPAVSRGRRLPEPESQTRNAFQRDRDRIIHSAAFRRLQYKTQVFVYHEGDHYRSRLTHSLEVSQIARGICRQLGLQEDLAEAVALAHDLGHTPFGHAGEDALDEVMRPYGGFDHNAQTLRILTRLERRYAAFDGLNLTWEVLEGAVKHNGPLVRPGETPAEAAGRVPAAILEYVAQHDLELATHAGPEAQVAALADDIAYNNHDIDDGLRAGLFRLSDLDDLPLVGEVVRHVAGLYPDAEPGRLSHEVARRLIGLMVDDVVAETRRRLGDGRPGSAAEVRAMPAPLVAFSPAVAECDQALKGFLRSHMYRHWRVNRMMSKSRRVVRELFGFYLDEPACLPPEWSALTDGPGTPYTARRVADFIAGMTDRYALRDHHRLFDTGAQD